MTQPAQPNPPMRKRLAAGIFIVIMIAIIWGCVAINNSGGTSRADDLDRMRMEAVNACETRITDQLRSPSTADFDSEATLSGGTWTVAGTVDSENALGGTVRSDYECTATIADGNVTTRILSLDQR